MARVTVEDCILVVPNRFELVALASQRAKDISSGAHLTVDRDNDKNTVVALREIADKTVSVEQLRDIVVQNSQRKIKTDKFETDPSQINDAPSDDVIQEIESFAVTETFSDDDNMTFVDENISNPDD